MKRLPILLFAAAMFASTVACSWGFALGRPASQSAAAIPVTSQIDPTPTPVMYIASVTMAKDVQGEGKLPVDPTDTFGKSDTVHAVVTIQDAPANTTFKSSWYTVDVGDAAPAGTLIDSVELTTDGSRNIDFSFTPPTAGWPFGTYRVQIEVNGQPATQTQFTVQ